MKPPPPWLRPLAEAIRLGSRVLWITGAGLSVASGIAPYRKSRDAHWERWVTDWGTVERFRADPVAWWTEYWLVSHPPNGPRYEPNPGHRALTELVTGRPDHGIITQNIDGLHRHAGVPEAQLIEVHGNIRLARCSARHCEYRTRQVIRDLDLSPARAAPPRAPCCPACGEPALPLALFFDEQYASHPYYRFPEALRWMNAARIIAFVGTSFSVGITALALDVAREQGATLYNFNVYPEQDLRNVLGPSEETLPALAALVRG